MNPTRPSFRSRRASCANSTPSLSAPRHIAAEIAEHVGSEPDEALARSLYGIVVGLILGDAIQREPDPALVVDLVNDLWRFRRWPLRIDVNRVQ